jgi:hypothetical protein
MLQLICPSTRSESPTAVFREKKKVLYPFLDHDVICLAA